MTPKELSTEPTHFSILFIAVVLGATVLLLFLLLFGVAWKQGIVVSEIGHYNVISSVFQLLKRCRKLLANNRITELMNQHNKIQIFTIFYVLLFVTLIVQFITVYCFKG